MKNGKNLIHSFTGTESERGNHQGLTKREYFAALAMQGLTSRENITPTWTENELEEEAEFCVKIADALLKALNDAK